MYDRKSFFEKWNEFINESKERKPGCTRKGEKGHNYNHDSDGKFSTESDATSWSNDIDYFGGNKTDCVGGKFKSDGKGRKMWSKLPCGKTKDGKKAKHKCKGDDLAETQAIGDALFDEWLAHLESHSNPYDRKILDNLMNEIELNEKRHCTTWAEFMRSLNALIASTKGELYKQRKKK